MFAELLRRPGRPLRVRLLLLLLGPLAVLLLASLFADYEIALEPNRTAYDYALADSALALAARVSVQDGRAAIDLSRTTEAVLLADQMDKVFFTVIGPQGERLAGNAALIPAAARSDDFSSPQFTDGSWQGAAVRMFTYRMPTAAGAVTVVMAETTAKRRHSATRIVTAIFWSNFLLILATLVIVYAGVRLALEPLDRLGADIARRTPHDLSPLVCNDVPQEAQPLVGAINELLGDLRSAAAAQQAFLANAAHQLRTPLAGLQTQIELAALDLPPGARSRIDRIGEAARRLGHLAHQLLSLARSGPEANLAHERESLDVGTLLAELVPQFFDAAIARGIDLGVEPHAVTVHGSRWLLREMLSNLLDNAIRYSAAGGRVTARSGRDADGRPFIEVEDDGPGIPADERERIFDRFYRGRDTAASEHAATGAGLGLAIVREVAERHAATVTITTPAGGHGASVRVSFPASPDGRHQA